MVEKSTTFLLILGLLLPLNQLKDVDADGVEGPVYGYRHYPDYIYNGKDKEEKNQIIDLKPGETQTVYAAFFVPENMLSCNERRRGTNPMIIITGFCLFLYTQKEKTDHGQVAQIRN